ncbi:MAG: serine protease [Scytonema sp. PMC 1069.18]|nr:serine protease [Scytonema sp. PMC 1069.18]
MSHALLLEFEEFKDKDMKTAQTPFANVRFSRQAKSTSKQLSISKVSKYLTVMLNLFFVSVAPTKVIAKDAPHSQAVAMKTEQKRLSQKQLLAESTKSAVRIVDGCMGKAYLRTNGKTYNLSAVGYGSGYFLSSNGYIVTNAHVVQLSQSEEECTNLLFRNFVKQVALDYYGENLSRYEPSDVKTLTNIVNQSKLLTYEPVRQVLLQDRRSLPFKTIVSSDSTSRGRDVAIVKINIHDAPFLKLADSEKVQLLDRVTVVGYPAAAEFSGSGSPQVPSITDGSVSAVKMTQDGSPVIQISAPATHGNSGGPAVNEQGEVIGIVAFRGDTVNDQEIQGFSFVIPSNTIREFVKLAGISDEKEQISQRSVSRGE